MCVCVCVCVCVWLIHIVLVVLDCACNQPNMFSNILQQSHTHKPEIIKWYIRHTYWYGRRGNSSLDLRWLRWKHRRQRNSFLRDWHAWWPNQVVSIVSSYLDEVGGKRIQVSQSDKGGRTVGAVLRAVSRQTDQVAEDDTILELWRRR